MSGPETGHARVNQIVAGHFHEKAGYAVWRSRGTDDWLIIYTVSGKGRLGYPGGEIIASPGEIVILRPGALHDYGVEPLLRRWEPLWAHFYPKPAWLELLDWPEEAPGLMRLALRDRAVRRTVATRMGQVNRLANGPLRRREDFAMNALEEVLLWCDLENPRSRHARVDGRVRSAMDFLCRNLARRISLGDLAAACGLSVSRLAHLFRAQVGATPQQFLEQQRLARAVQLLELTPLSIKEISTQVGFASPFYFTLRFKRHLGKSPTAYRGR